MKGKKLPYDNAELEVVKFSGGDVITASEGNWDLVDPDGGDWGSDPVTTPASVNSDWG